MAVPWLPSQPSFINALQSGASAGFQSAQLAAQEAARQRAIEQANADREFQVWRTQEMMRQQAEQNALANNLKQQAINEAIARQKATQAHWDMQAKAAANKPVPYGAAILDENGNYTIPSPRVTAPPQPKIFKNASGQVFQVGADGKPLLLDSTTTSRTANPSFWDRSDYSALQRELFKIDSDLGTPVIRENMTEQEVQDKLDRKDEIRNLMQQMRPVTMPAPGAAATGARIGMDTSPEAGTLTSPLLGFKPSIYVNPEEVRAAVKNGRLDRAEAIKILKEQFGME